MEYQINRPANVSIQVITILGQTVVNENQGYQSNGTYQKELHFPGIQSITAPLIYRIQVGDKMWSGKILPHLF